MKKQNLIIHLVLIALMLCIITVGVIYLYSDMKPAASDAVEYVEETPATDLAAAEDVKPEPAKEETSKADAAQESEAKPAKAAASKNEFTVKNSGTGKMNTLKQNSDNSLELIDHNGKRLWKIAFPGRIVGEPAQIDIYNNMKIQFLIAEGSTLHLIDRLGREVKAFPIALPAAAKSGPKDIKSGNVVYWKIETAKSAVYFDKKTKTIINQLP